MNIKSFDIAPKAVEAEGFLKALANRHRLMVLCELHKGEHSVSRLHDAISLSQSSMSQHLARLREDGLVKTRREAQTIFYSLASPDVSRVIGLLYELFCAKQCDGFTSANERPEPESRRDQKRKLK
jgi:ArsR family transcriptional regulator, virulence genes transcriptional regulator